MTTATDAPTGPTWTCEIQWLKGGKFWTHLRTVVVPASSVQVAIAKAARIGKAALPKGTKRPGMLVKALPIRSVTAP
jgi:hypothetical protein